MALHNSSLGTLREELFDLDPSTKSGDLAATATRRSLKGCDEQLEAQDDHLSFSEAQQRFQSLAYDDLKHLGRPASVIPQSRHYSTLQLQEMSKIVATEKAMQELRQKYAEEFGDARMNEVAANRLAKEQAEAKQKEERMEMLRSFRAARQTQQREKKRSYYENCKQNVDRWNDDPLTELQHSVQSLLPLDVWTKILESFCDTLELDGVRGPSVIARELSNAAMVNKELYAASLPAFQLLSSKCQPIAAMISKVRKPKPQRRYRRKCCFYEGYENPKAEKPAPTVPEEEVWDLLVSEPTSVPLSQLKALSGTLGLQVSHPKPVLVASLMAHLQLKRPMRAPARLAVAVLEEKQEDWPWPHRLSAGCLKPLDTAHREIYQALCGQKFESRKRLLKLGLSTMQAFEEATRRAPSKHVCA